MTALLRHWRPASGLLALAVCAALIFLRLFIPAGAGSEYIYTVKCLFQFLLPPLLLWAIFIFFSLPFFRKHKHSRLILIFLLAGACLIGATFLLPNQPDVMPWRLYLALSICWAAGLFCLGAGFFLLAASGSSLRVSACCFAGSICLALAVGEAYLLLAPRRWAGLHYDNPASRHFAPGKVEAGLSNWEEGVCGAQARRQGQPVANAHRYLRYEDEIFDVVYEFDGMGRRPMPPASPHPECDLLIFGCSFTYGHGLNTEDTWAWKLARLLGSAWQVQNYGGNGYSANQMLCFLEHDMVAPPTAPHRYALFLAIEDHLRRNEFFSSYPHYILDAQGWPKREGEGRYRWISSLSSTFNGLQLARLASYLASQGIMRARRDEATALYLALLQHSAAIFKQKYDTELIVLLWPDFEDLAPALQKLHIPVILARTMLPAWDDPAGSKYRIDPLYEAHPNARAGTDLATGLAAYFEKLAASWQ